MLCLLQHQRLHDSPTKDSSVVAENWRPAGTVDSSAANLTWLTDVQHLHQNQIRLSLCKTKENRIHNMSGSPSDRANTESSLMHRTLPIKMIFIIQTTQGNRQPGANTDKPEFSKRWYIKTKSFALCARRKRIGFTTWVALHQIELIQSLHWCIGLFLSKWFSSYKPHKATGNQEQIPHKPEFSKRWYIKTKSVSLCARRKRIGFTTWVALHQIELIQSLHWCIGLFLSKWFSSYKPHKATGNQEQIPHKPEFQQALIHQNQIRLSLCKTKENRIHNMSGSPSDRANTESSLMHRTLPIKMIFIIQTTQGNWQPGANTAQARVQQALVHQNQILLSLCKTKENRIHNMSDSPSDRANTESSLMHRTLPIKMIFIIQTTQGNWQPGANTAQARVHQALKHQNQILLSLCKTKENRIHNMSGSPSDRANTESSLLHRTLPIKNELSSYEPHKATGNQEQTPTSQSSASADTSKPNPSLFVQDERESDSQHEWLSIRQS